MSAQGGGGGGGGCLEIVRSFAEVAKYQGSGDNTIWVDTGESHLRSSLGTLKNCLVGSWKERLDALPSVKEVDRGQRQCGG